LCPIQRAGAASHSGPSRTILHNESATGKRFLRQPITKPPEPIQTALLGDFQVRKFDRKEKMNACPSDNELFAERRTSLKDWPV
jgi:hypothetical protein